MLPLVGLLLVEEVGAVAVVVVAAELGVVGEAAVVAAAVAVAAVAAAVAVAAELVVAEEGDSPKTLVGEASHTARLRRLQLFYLDFFFVQFNQTW